MKHLHVLAPALLACCGPSLAGDVATTTMAISATIPVVVAPQVSVDATIGNIDMATSSGSRAALSVDCANGGCLGISVSLNGGTNPTSEGRFIIGMTSGYRLRYEVYSDDPSKAGAVKLDPSVSAPRLSTSTHNKASFDLFIKVPVDPKAAADTYRDTLTATLTY